MNEMNIYSDKIYIFEGGKLLNNKNNNNKLYIILIGFKANKNNIFKQKEAI